MSRLYFHSPSATAELAGAERHWLRHLAMQPADAAWNFDLKRAGQFLARVPEVPDGPHGANYLHTYLRGAQSAQADDRFRRIQRLLIALKTALNVSDLTVMVHGVRLCATDISHNTALVAGSDPIALSAKLSGWQEQHAWIDGRARRWCANIIERGLTTGLYRRGMGWEGPAQHLHGPGVIPLLLARNDEPIVISSSVADSFPNPAVGAWMPPWPDGVERNWDALTEEQQEQRRVREEEWGDLTDQERWDISMRGLRADRPWAKLSPAYLREYFFGWPVTVYDLFNPDRDEHLHEVLANAPGHQKEGPNS